MKKLLINVFVLILLLSYPYLGQCQHKPGHKRPDSLNIDYQVVWTFSAYSSPKNAIPSNGEAHSDNLPKKVTGEFKRQGFYLLLNTKDTMVASNIITCRLYLVNTSDSLVTLDAQDSRLRIIPEAMDDKGIWTAIGFYPSSDCGNSYHLVKLDTNEYWQFKAPLFRGKIKTQLRYSLILKDGKKISSNAIEVSINKEQLIPRKKRYPDE